MKNIIKPVDTDDGLFHDGDPTTETEGTIVYARIMNDIQGATISLQTELSNVLAEAGLTPDPAKENQLLQAIQKIITSTGEGEFLPLTGGSLTGPLKTKSTMTVYEDDVLTVSEFLYSYKESGVQVNKISIKAICDADGAGHWVVEVNSAQAGDKRVQAFGIDGKSKIVTTMNNFMLYEGTERVYSKNNPPPAPDALPLRKEAIAVDLNTLGDISAAGIYFQPANAGATAANHYPVSEAGSLLVTPSAYGCQQEYTTFGTGRKFLRGLSGAWNGTNGPWGNWNELYGPTNPNEIVSTSANSYRMVGGNYGAFWRQDGSHLYLMLTDSGDQHGNYNSLRPFVVDLVTGYPTMGRLNLTDWTYFDARYQAKGSFAAPDTSGISGNVLWWKNTATGVIQMMGITTSVPNSGRVTFPFAFPSKCFSVVANRNNSTGEAAAMQPYSIDTTGWNLRIAGGGTETVTWFAAGK